VKTPNPSEILRRELKRKQRTQPQYSIRALARDLGVNSSYLSGVFNGKKPVPLQRVSEIAKRLEMDELAIITLKRAITINQVPASQRALLSSPSEGLNPSSLDKLENVRQASKSELKLWSKWYYVAVLDLSTCDNFVSEVKWIARRLKIPLGDAAEAVDFLLQHKYFIEQNGQWTKADLHLRLPAVASKEIVRNFHKQYMLKAIEVMQSQTTPEEYAKRLITGVVIASNAEKIKEAKNRLELALVEISQILLEGECTELYQLGAQLFPLT
jgi:uncharacterized protein (TIGR02147 family)